MLYCVGVSVHNVSLIGKQLVGADLTQPDGIVVLGFADQSICVQADHVEQNIVKHKCHCALSVLSKHLNL